MGGSAEKPDLPKVTAYGAQNVVIGLGRRKGSRNIQENGHGWLESH